MSWRSSNLIGWLAETRRERERAKEEGARFGLSCFASPTAHKHDNGPPCASLLVIRITSLQH
jgi:hypothetical protein